MGYKYKRIYLTAGSTLLGLFAILMAVGLQITDISGDFSCEGTLESPCMSQLRISNPTAKNIYVYNKGGFKIDFSPNIKDYAFFVKDGRCSGKLTGSSCSCYVMNGTEIAYKGWRCLDFTNRTKPSQKRLYMYKWPAYSTKEHLLVGFKYNPTDEIKWTTGMYDENGNLVDELDPIWFGIPSENYTVKQGDWLNETRSRIITEELNLTFNETINGTEYEFPYIETREYIEMYFHSEIIDNGNIYIEGINYTIEGFYCDFKEDDLWIECDSKYDGNGDGYCQRTGGETCIIYNLGAENETFETEFEYAGLIPGIEDEIGVVKYE